MMDSPITDLDVEIVELTPYVPAERTDTVREVAFKANAWTPEELDLLRSMFAGDATLDEIVSATGHRLHGVRSKIWELGLRRNTARPWSELEDADLARRYGAEPAARIAIDLGRGCASVYSRASLLGLSQEGAPDYEPWEDAQIAAGYSAGVPVGQIAALIGRTFVGVIYRARVLDLRHASRPPDWSDAEMARALELAHTGLGYAEIRTRLFAEGYPVRSKQGFGLRLRKLGYGRGWGRPWTPDEDAILRAAYASGESLSLVAHKTGRDRWSVSSRSTVLKLQGSHPRPNGFRQGPDWSAKDEAKLRAEYGHKPAKQLALELKRPLRAVYCHAHQLGLKSDWARPFSDEDDLAMRTAWLCGVPLMDLAVAMGRDQAVISKRAIRRGFSFSDPRRPNPPKTGVRKSADRPLTLAAILALARAADIAGGFAELGVALIEPAPRGRRKQTGGEACDVQTRIAA